MTKILSVVALAALAVAANACTAGANDEVADDSQAQSAELKGEDNAGIAEVRRATAKYHDVNVALADGYHPDAHCVAIPGGGMGIHYLNFELLGRPPEQNRPAILLYEPTADGLRLVGVEWFTPVFVNGAPWFQPASVPPPPPYNDAPVILGRAFHGPMPGHNDQMPWHYDLHAWIWKHNPAGMFEDWNPAVTCPQ